MTDENAGPDAAPDSGVDSAESEDSVADTVANTPVSLKGDGRMRFFVLRVLPALVLLLGAGAGILQWQDSSHRAVENARVDSVAAARDATVAILSYKADSVEQDLRSATDRLTGTFLDSFTDLINKVVIPGAKEKKITAIAQVSAAASVSATAEHAVALVFVDQTVTIDGGAPSGTASSVRVTLDKADDRWLVSGFDPV
ncbi:MAG: hypothetical protein ACOYO2_12145 [Mycobacterium sp.]|jgi:Mce-associated membrane protein